MSSDNPESLIVSTPGTCGGKPRIGGHRITVENVAIWHERMGWSVDEICAQYDLTLGQVYGALSYYFDHQEEIDNRIKYGEKVVESMRAKNPSRLEEKLRGHKSA